ncbi:MAG TPA: DUF5074 domain-containing protein [Candidatus Kapabacteria bacterium]|nr:DUF5074 domain-containing protein [Candidatus Kapabacteria bacterium]
MYKKLASQFMLLLFVAATLASCESGTEDPHVNAVIKKPSLLVLNEGAFQSSNASLDVIDLSSSVRTENIIPNFGDVGSDVELINDRIYVVSSNSRKLYAMDPLEGTVVSNFNFSGEGASPNAIVKISDNEALVTHLFLPRIDVIALGPDTVKSSITVGQGTGDIIVMGNKAYATASSSVLYVIDLSTKTLIDSLAVGDVPHRVLADPDRDQLITYSQGNWPNGTANISFVDASSLEVRKKVDIQAGSFVNKIIMGQGKIFAVHADKVESMDLVSGIPTTFATKGYLGGIYDKSSNELYLGSGDYTTPGKVDVLDATLGTVKRSYQAGIAPTHFALYR